MMLSIVIQVFITITAPTAVWLLSKGLRNSACVVGLMSQVGFFLLYATGSQYIMFIPTLIYVLVWIDCLRRVNGKQ